MNKTTTGFAPTEHLPICARCGGRIWENAEGIGQWQYHRGCAAAERAAILKSQKGGATKATMPRARGGTPVAG